MACACKRKLGKPIKSDNGIEQYKKKGMSLYMDAWIVQPLARIVIALILAILIMIIAPLLLVVLLWTQITEGRARIPFPKKFLDKAVGIENFGKL